MTLREKWFAVAGLLLVVVAIIAMRQWLEERDARVKAESVQAAQSQVIDQAKKDGAAAKADEAQVASDLKTQLAAIAAQRQQPVTPAQFVLDMGKMIPNLPQAATVIQTPATTQTVNGKTETTPPQAAIEIPAADLPALQDYKLTCDANGAKLTACEKTAADQVAQLNAAAAELGAVTKERDDYKAEAKGGTFLHRLTKGAKCLAASGAASAAGAWVDKKEPARGAAIGVVLGGIGCQVF